ncbi:DUF21 domain-containing protein [Camellia lanceoleosa]|uniref:DUF21 domain-containing protein n=1 Tax=Camellia lanceoleosa TaxID=1840588 RepID=A0ACC0ITP0_9ERIC|nr:DUF21 domain-containing protein [Camellia lanceoleosa]
MAANNVLCCETMFWVYLLISAALVAFAGLMSGLTLGLMSLSLVDLEVLTKAGQPPDRKNAEKILPIVKNQHFLLCTLLICNAMAMEALPIFLDALLPAWGAILISVSLILAFGEIIPQAVCSRYGLRVGAKLSVVVRLLVKVVIPIAYPVSKLDWLLGKGHSALLSQAELKTLVGMHGNEDTMSLIMSKGNSRVPVYSGSPSNIIGLILVKSLIRCCAEEKTPIRILSIRRIPRVEDSLPLYDILNQFQKGHSHMAAVVKSKHNDKDSAGNATDKNDMITININSNSSILQKQAEGKFIRHQFLLIITLRYYGPPISPFVQSPFIRPNLSASPAKSTPNSPSIRTSPSSHQVSRKTYEKLRKPAFLGIACGTVSSSSDHDKKGSLLGFEKTQNSWVEV